MYRASRNHDLQTWFGLLVTYIFHIVTRLVLSICRLDILKELRDVSVVAETYECFGVMPCSAYIVTFVLSSEWHWMLMFPVL